MISTDDHISTPGCPVRCLRTVLPRTAFNPLTRSLSTRTERAITVPNVLDPYRQSQLRGIPGLGPRRRAATEQGLFIAGLTGPRQPVSHPRRKEHPR